MSVPGVGAKVPDRAKAKRNSQRAAAHLRRLGELPETVRKRGRERGNTITKGKQEREGQRRGTKEEEEEALDIDGRRNERTGREGREGEREKREEYGYRGLEKRWNAQSAAVIEKN